MKHRPLIATAALAVLGLFAPVAAVTAEQQGAWEWNGAPRVVAVGDVHGTWDGLIELLQGSGIIDGELRWSGNGDHLVVVGDFVDRNVADRPIMDLLRRLERESIAAGGRVHVLLGNHEVMNLVRDLRYVNPDSYADFADEESEQERSAARKSFYSENRRRLRPAELRRAFDERFPPGYFARQRMFDPDGEYGRWLLGLPVVVKVNGYVFVHGGLTERIASLGLSGINDELAAELQRHLSARTLLERQGIVGPLMEFSEIQDAAERVLQRRSRRSSQPEIREAAHDILNLANSRIVGEQGPLWYRGNSIEDERIERLRLEQSLELLDAKAMVVAHSPTPNHRITKRFGGLLFRVDHGIYEGHQPLALVLDEGQTAVLDPSTRQLSRPPDDPMPQGETWVGNRIELSDAKMEQFLSRARVVSIRDLGRGSTRPQLLELEEDGQSARAIFKTVEEDSAAAPGGAVNRYQHEVAAYLLDRELGLGMVPVTVVRSVEGRRGSLQKWIEGAVDQQSLHTYGLKVEREDVLARQLGMTRVFDALIGNRDRSTSDVLWLPTEARVLLIDHSRAFPVAALPSDQNGPAEAIDPELVRRLEALGEERVRETVGTLLDAGQVASLLERRAAILERAAVAHRSP